MDDYSNEEVAAMRASAEEQRIKRAEYEKGQIEDKLARAIRDADTAFVKTGGTTRHYVTECLLPSLATEGLVLSLTYRPWMR